MFAPPSITSNLTATAASGYPFDYQITTSSPATSFTATGLPAGLTLNPATGQISGATSALGRYDVDLAATNSTGTGPSATLALTVRLPSTAQVATGGVSSLAALDNGTVVSWGINDAGNLGDGTNTDRHAPVSVTGPTDVVMVAAGARHSLALTADGKLWSWGGNLYGERATGSTSSSNSPVVTPVTNAVAVAANDYHTLVIKADGTVWGWGYNADGELGDGTTTTTTTNLQGVQMTGMTSAIVVATGRWHTAVLKANGTVWTSGRNTYGALGDGTTTQRLTPVQVPGLTAVVLVAAGIFHSVALKNDGTVWTWGTNTHGQLGDGTTTTRLTPVQVAGLTGVVAVASGATHTLALKDDGTVWAWGENNYGQLGDGSTTNRLTPVQVNGLSGVVAIAADYHSLAVRADGTLRAWGRNDYGQVGDDTITGRVTPVAVALPPSPTLVIVGGDNQAATPDTLNPQPFDLAVWNPAGTAPLVAAPVTFSVKSGGGQLAATNTGSPALSASLTLQTDPDGTVQAYYQQPAVAGIASEIRAVAGTGEISFQTVSAAVANPDSDGDGLLDAWEIAHFGTLLHGPDGDPDFDGLLNVQELAQGKNPRVFDAGGGGSMPVDYQLVIKVPAATYLGVRSNTWRITTVSAP